MLGTTPCMHAWYHPMHGSSLLQAHPSSRHCSWTSYSRGSHGVMLAAINTSCWGGVALVFPRAHVTPSTLTLYFLPCSRIFSLFVLGPSSSRRRCLPRISLASGASRSSATVRFQSSNQFNQSILDPPFTSLPPTPSPQRRVAWSHRGTDWRAFGVVVSKF